MNEQRMVVMGLGNLLQANEDLGVRVTERLYAHYHWPEDVETVDGGTQGLSSLGYVESAGHLLIPDTIDYGLEPGALRTCAGGHIPAYLSAKKMSLHQGSFSEMLALADIRGHLPTHTALVGLQPATLDDYGDSLSRLTREQLPAAEWAALAQLAAWGIMPQPADGSRCLSYSYLPMENYEGVRLRQYRIRLEEQGRATAHYLMRCDNECQHVAERRSVNAILTTGLRKRQTAQRYQTVTRDARQKSTATR